MSLGGVLKSPAGGARAEHIQAAERKIEQTRSREKRKAHRPKSNDE